MSDRREAAAHSNELTVASQSVQHRASCLTVWGFLCLRVPPCEAVSLS